MNVKKNSISKLSKDRSLKDLSAGKNAVPKNVKSKIGEEIRKKIKVNNNANSGIPKINKENVNHNTKSPSAKKNIEPSAKKSLLQFVKPS